MVAGTPIEASYIWNFFFQIGLKMLEAMTLGIVNGLHYTSSRYACTVLGTATSFFDDFEEKFEFCLHLALTRALIQADDEDPVIDSWDFTEDEDQITRKLNPFCRWLWAELVRLVGSIFIPILRSLTESVPIALLGG